MNTFKRIVAVVLSVCMVGVLALSATAAPIAPAADGSYTYSFVDALTLERSNGSKVSTFGADSAAIPESNNVAQGMWNDYYEDGTLNWSYPQIPGTGGSSDKTAGSVVYNNGGVSGNYTSFQFKDGALLFKATTVENMAWWILKIKAPAVGTYDVSITHNTANNSGARHTKVQIIPAFDLPDADNYDAAAHNANIDAIVAAGTGMLSGTLDCDMNKTATGEVTNMGSVTLTDVNADEYFVIFSTDLSKSDAAGGVRTYLQSLKFTPVAETANGEVYSLNRTATGAAANLMDIGDKYASGASNWTVANRHGSVSNFNMDYTKLTAGYTMYGVAGGVTTQKWVALKLKAPVAGKYELVVNSGTVNGNTDSRSGTPMNAYLIDASTIENNYQSTLEALITEDNLIGYYEYGRGNLRGSYGLVDLDAEEYILILQAANTVTATTKWTTDYDHANNFYITSIELNGSSAMIGDTAYATIADAAEAAQSGDVIKLLKDYVGAIDLPAGVALDLNGYTWTVNSITTTNASESIIDSAGGGKLVAKEIDLFGNNAKVLPLATRANTYALAEYELTVVANDYEQSPANPAATRFWFKLNMDRNYLNEIADGETGLTIGVNLSWGGAEDLAVTFDNGNGAEAFAAAWAAAARDGSNVWLYVDITGVSGLTNDLVVTPVLQVSNSALNNGSLVYEVA